MIGKKSPNNRITINPNNNTNNVDPHDNDTKCGFQNVNKVNSVSTESVISLTCWNNFAFLSNNGYNRYAIVAIHANHNACFPSTFSAGHIITPNKSIKVIQINIKKWNKLGFII